MPAILGAPTKICLHAGAVAPRCRCYAIGLETAFLKETIETELSPSRTVYWDIVNLFRKGIVTTKKPPERNIAKTFLPAWEGHRRLQSAAMGGHRTLEG